MISSLARGRRSGGDDSHHLLSLGKGYQGKSLPCRKPDQNLSNFSFGMGRIRENPRLGVVEGCDGLFERRLRASQGLLRLSADPSRSSRAHSTPRSDESGRASRTPSLCRLTAVAQRLQRACADGTRLRNFELRVAIRCSNLVRRRGEWSLRELSEPLPEPSTPRRATPAPDPAARAGPAPNSGEWPR